MSKKIFIAIGILLAIIFSFNMTFANNGMDNAVNDVRNVVGGAENAVEGAVKDISNASKDATGDMENSANNTTTGMTNDNRNDNNNVNSATRTTNNNNGSYTATRTAATDDTTFMGMGSTAWTWLILGIAAIAIVALVWYYSMQLTSSQDSND